MPYSNWGKKLKIALFTSFFSVLKILPVHRKDSIFCTRVTPPGRGRSHSLPPVWEKQGAVSAFTCVLANFQRSHSLSQSQTHPARPVVQSITGNFSRLTFSPVFQFFTMQKLLLTFGLYKNRQLAWIWCICHGSLFPVVDSEALLWVLMFIWAVRKEKSRWWISGNPKKPLAPSEPGQMWSWCRRACCSSPSLGDKNMLIYQIIITSRIKAEWGLTDVSGHLKWL